MQSSLAVCVGVGERDGLFAGWLLACLTSQQHASVSQGRICTILRAATPI